MCATGSSTEIEKKDARHLPGYPGDSRMRVMLVTQTSFPNWFASADRIHKYAIGLKEAGAAPFVVGFCSGNSSENQTGWNHTEDGIPYINLPMPCRCESSTPARYRFLRRKLAAMFDDFLAKEKVDVLFHYQDSHFISSPLINICRKNNIPYVGELNELLPAQGYKGMYLSPWFWDRQYYLCHTLKRISGVVAISSFLENYLQKRQIPVIRVPALGMDKADCLPAKPNCKNRNDIFTVVYTGLLAPRDIPLTLLESVRRAVRLGVPMKLLIIGIADHLKSGRVAKKIVADDSLLSSHVKFTGWVSDSELKLQMAEANAMVLVREDSKQTRACFPTRLPQYFLAGKPVILSAVGDMPLYFTHKQNAWLVPGGNHPQEIAEAFHYLWQHPAEADAIGQHGRETALTQFSCKLHGKRLYDFFTTLSEKARR